MKILTLNVNLGLIQVGNFIFSEKINLIYSKKNSVGKSTLLRMLLYALGYPIPSLRGINFDNYDLELILLDDLNSSWNLQRRNDYISLVNEKEAYHFSLPSDLHSVHEKIFRTNNIEVLDNLLGAFYMDQEKGWTLLNRGVAIGKIRFSIEALVRGLSNRTDNKLLEELKIKKREVEKYKYMFDMSKYQNQIKKLGENIAYDTPAEEVDIQIKTLLNEREPIKNELERIKSVITDNKSLIDYISKYKIVVRNDDGVEIPVNANTIKYYRENENYLIAKRKIYEKKITDIDRKISNLQKLQENENILIKLQTTTQLFDAKVLGIPLDQIALEKTIGRINKEIKDLETTLTNKIKVKNPIVTELFEYIRAYALKLNIDDKYVRPYEDYVFTDDLKSLSGAIFHKIVFCFKMSYIKIILKYTGIKLPIILDSPSGREIDEINIKEMIEMLKKEFVEHQVIIASIHTYNFKDVNIISLVDTLLHAVHPEDKIKSDNKKGVHNGD
jgi:hypothetical protein